MEFRSHWEFRWQEREAPSFSTDPIWEVKIDQQTSWACRHRPQHLHGLLRVLFRASGRGARHFSGSRAACLWRNHCLHYLCLRPERQVMAPRPTRSQIGNAPVWGRVWITCQLQGPMKKGGNTGRGILEPLSWRHFLSFLFHLPMGWKKEICIPKVFEN